ncbi:MAG: penicillin-binding protein 2 [Patescibacteria group bacterium]
MNSNSIPRIRLIAFFVCFFALLIVVKLYMVQIVQGNIYTEKADRQYVAPQGELFNRGTVFFTSNSGEEIAAATSKDGYVVVMVPKEIEDAEKAYELVSTEIDLDKTSFLAKAAKKEDPYEELKKRVEKETGDAIDAMKIPGIRIFKDRWRVYPGEELASHAIGLIGYKDNVLAGRYGIERSYEETLSRSSGATYKNFFAEIFSGIEKAISGDPIQGDVVTTIDPEVERVLETKLGEVVKQWSPEHVGGIIMNPKTGQIYAMASKPSFNPNLLKDVSDPKVFSNPLVEYVYEFGSIVKPLTMSVGIDSGAVTPTTHYNDVGTLVLNNKRISNFDGKARGWVDMQEVLSQSLNTGIAHIVSKIGNDTFSEYMLNFGFSDKTGIDLPNESGNIIENLKSKRDVEHVTAGYGQGIALTPVSMVRSLAALANGGTLVTPHVVSSINYDVGGSKTLEFPPGRRVLKKETTVEVTKMLVKVVDTALLKGKIKMEHYSIAAKTGTAQVADQELGGYHADQYLHSFFGYFPAYDPKFIVFLYQVNPKGAQYASETLTMPFADIAKFLVTYYQVPPDR